MQRRLTEQGITFQRLLDEARRELAHHYLLHSSRELSETAYLIGYEDANSFFCAFQHRDPTWTVAVAQKELAAGNARGDRGSVKQGNCRDPFMNTTTAS